MLKTASFVMGLTCGCVVFTAAAARGIEPPKPENRVEFEVKVHSPWLARVPFLKQVFAQVAEQEACEHKACEHKIECQAGPCPIGVDFAFPTHHGHGPLVLFSHPLAAAPGICQACPPPGVACAAACTAAKCGADCACSAKSAGCDCDDCRCCQECSGASRAKHDRDSLIEHILEISTEKAALEAVLEAHTSFAEERQEMFESLAELTAENAKLTAKLEFQAEREELHKQFQELAAQNAHLKAEVALTEARVKLMQESFQLAVEKQRLEQRVAELERHALQGNVRTAKQPHEIEPAR